jgi:hypothetical protein
VGRENAPVAGIGAKGYFVFNFNVREIGTRAADSGRRRRSSAATFFGIFSNQLMLHLHTFVR